MVVAGFALIALVLSVLSVAMEPGTRFTLMIKIAVVMLAIALLIPAAAPYIGG